MKTLLLAAATCGLLVSGSAFAACTQEDATKKGQELQAAFTAALQKDPSKAQELMGKVQAVTSKYQNSTSYDEACKAYDELKESIK